MSRETSEKDSREQSEDGDQEQSQDTWFQPLFKKLAETQKQIARSIGNGGTGSKKKLLANVKLDEFNGGRAVTSYQYRAWKKSVGITQELYSLTGYLDAGWRKSQATAGRLGWLPKEDEVGTNHSRSECSRDGSSDGFENVERCRSRKQRPQVIFNCGGMYDPDRMETVLQVTYPKIGTVEQKHGLVRPSRSVGQRSGSVPKKPLFARRTGTTKFKRKVHEVHEVREEDAEPQEQSEYEAESESDEDHPSGMVEEPNPSDDERTEEEFANGDELNDQFATFVAGWKAKNETADARKKRGFDSRKA